MGARSERDPEVEAMIRVAVLRALRQTQVPMSDQELSAVTGFRFDWVGDVLEVMIQDGLLDYWYEGQDPSRVPHGFAVPAFPMVCRLTPLGEEVASQA